MDSPKEFDVFICHATEDKEHAAHPLAEELQARGYAVWYDKFVLTLGDSLRQKIDEGLARSRFGVVVLSHHFFAKEWPQRELDGLAAREAGGVKIILPVWHQIDLEEIRARSPMLAGRMAVSTDKGIAAVVEEVVKAVGAPTRDSKPRLDGSRSRPRLSDSSPVPVEQLDELASELAETMTTEELHRLAFGGPDEPIKIVGIVEEEVGRPRNDGSRGSALYPVPLRLSRTPSSHWEEIFLQLWNNPPRYTHMHRPGIARMDGDRIVLDGTTLEEIEQYHRETLKLVVEETNRIVAELEQKERARRDREAEDQRKHRENVRDVAKRLRFD